MVDMICEIDPCYKKYVLTNKKTGKKKLYGKLTKAVYGTLLGGILFYQKLSGQLYEWVYKQNPYDLYIFNKMVNGEQLTIQFHVDDLKCSHPLIINFLRSYYRILYSHFGNPIACSLLGGVIPSQNSGYKITRLYPSLC